MNGLLITERRVAAGLTIRLLAERLGVDARSLEDLERAWADRVSVHLLERVCTALDLDPAEVLAPPSAAPPAATDDRKVEAALAEHGGVLTRDDLAAALGWPLNRLERALLALASRLRPTGLRLHWVTWNSYALSPNLGVLSGKERRQLHRLHAGRTGLAESVAFILLGVVTGYRSQDWLFRLPPEDRNGIELLVRQGLIQRDSRDVYWEPSPDVIDSLFLQADE